MRWEAKFSADQILVLSLGQLISEPTRLQQRLYAHLGLSSCSGMPGEIPKQNSASAHGSCTAGRRFNSRPDCESAGGNWTLTELRVTAIDCATKERLARVFAPWNDRLFAARPDLGVPWKLSISAEASDDHVPCEQGMPSGPWPNQSEPQAAAWARRIFWINIKREVPCSIASLPDSELRGLD